MSGLLVLHLIAVSIGVRIKILRRSENVALISAFSMVDDRSKNHHTNSEVDALYPIWHWVDPICPWLEGRRGKREVELPALEGGELLCLVMMPCMFLH